MKNNLLIIILTLTLFAVHAQEPTGFNITDVANAENSFEISIEFDASAAGPVLTTSGNIAVFVPKEFTSATVNAINGGNWSVVNFIPNASLGTFCSGSEGDFALVVLGSSSTSDNLGSVTAGVGEDLMTVVLTGAAGPLTSDMIQLYDPSGGDALSVCLAGLGIDNTITVDPDGLGGAADAIGYSAIGEGSEGAAFALPIELSSFEVSKRGDNSSYLTWTTEVEENASHFEIERSYSGSSYDYVGSVSAEGESKETIDYNFIDSEIDLLPNQNTIVYYRLKMIDHDGYFEYSDVKSVTFGAREIEVEVHPNPTVDFVTITADSKITGVTVINIDGKIIRDNVAYDSKLDLSNLNSGMYKILISTENGSFLKSVVKVD